MHLAALVSSPRIGFGHRYARHASLAKGFLARLFTPSIGCSSRCAGVSKPEKQKGNKSLEGPLTDYLAFSMTAVQRRYRYADFF